MLAYGASNVGVVLLLLVLSLLLVACCFAAIGAVAIGAVAVVSGATGVCKKIAPSLFVSVNNSNRRYGYFLFVLLLKKTVGGHH